MKLKACTNNVNNSYITNILNKRFCLKQNINSFREWIENYLSFVKTIRF